MPVCHIPWLRCPATHLILMRDVAMEHLDRLRASSQQSFTCKRVVLHHQNLMAPVQVSGEEKRRSSRDQIEIKSSQNKSEVKGNKRTTSHNEQVSCSAHKLCKKPQQQENLRIISCSSEGAVQSTRRIYLGASRVGGDHRIT